METKLSVIVPIYNVEPYIEVCLNSIFNQTYNKNFEVLLVDDCGNDKSVEIAKELIEQKCPSNQNFKIFHHKVNQGLSAARNTGISAARGEYVYFLDSDDLLTPECFEILLGLADKHPEAQMIVGQFDELSEEENYHPSEWPQTGGFYNGDILGFFVQLKIPTIACNKLVKRQFLLQNTLLFEVGLIHEDYLWSFQVSGLMNCVAVADRVTYHYLQRSGSIQHGYDFIRHQLNYARASALQTKFLFKHGLEKDIRVFRFIDKFRRNLVGDVYAKGDKDTLEKILRLFHESPYWSIFSLIKLGASPKEILRRLLKPNWI